MLHFLRITGQTLVSFFRVPAENHKERIEPKLRFGPTPIVHRRCSCIATDELLDVSTSEPVFTFKPGDTPEDIARGIAEFLRHLKNHRRGFRPYDEDDLRWLERLDSREE